VHEKFAKLKDDDKQTQDLRVTIEHMITSLDMARALREKRLDVLTEIEKFWIDQQLVFANGAIFSLALTCLALPDPSWLNRLDITSEQVCGPSTQTRTLVAMNGLNTAMMMMLSPSLLPKRTAGTADTDAEIHNTYADGNLTTTALPAP